MQFREGIFSNERNVNGDFKCINSAVMHFQLTKYVLYKERVHLSRTAFSNLYGLVIETLGGLSF